MDFKNLGFDALSTTKKAITSYFTSTWKYEIKSWSLEEKMHIHIFLQDVENNAIRLADVRGMPKRFKKPVNLCNHDLCEKIVVRLTQLHQNPDSIVLKREKDTSIDPRGEEGYWEFACMFTHFDRRRISFKDPDAAMVFEMMKNCKLFDLDDNSIYEKIIDVRNALMCSPKYKIPKNEMDGYMTVMKDFLNAVHQSKGHICEGITCSFKQKIMEAHLELDKILAKTSTCENTLDNLKKGEEQRTVLKSKASHLNTQCLPLKEKEKQHTVFTTGTLADSIDDIRYTIWSKGPIALNITRSAISSHFTSAWKNEIQSWSFEKQAHIPVFLKDIEDEEILLVEIIEKRKRFNKSMVLCNHDLCKEIFDRLLQLHQNPRNIVLKHDQSTAKYPQRECSLWKLARMYRHGGDFSDSKPSTCLEDTEAATVFKMMKNCRLFDLDDNIVYENIIGVRNVLMHSPTNQLTYDELDGYMKVMKEFLDAVHASEGHTCDQSLCSFERKIQIAESELNKLLERKTPFERTMNDMDMMKKAFEDQRLALESEKRSSEISGISSSTLDLLLKENMKKIKYYTVFIRRYGHIYRFHDQATKQQEYEKLLEKDQKEEKERILRKEKIRQKQLEDKINEEVEKRVREREQEIKKEYTERQQREQNQDRQREQERQREQNQDRQREQDRQRAQERQRDQDRQREQERQREEERQREQERRLNAHRNERGNTDGTTAVGAAMMGAAMGSSLGPLGAAVGGAIGLVTSIFR